MKPCKLARAPFIGACPENRDPPHAKGGRKTRAAFFVPIFCKLFFQKHFKACGRLVCVRALGDNGQFAPAAQFH